VRISWYDEATGRKKGDASRRAKLCGERQVFVYYAAFFVPSIFLAGRLRARSKPQLLSHMSSALAAPCPFFAASPPKIAAKTKRGRYEIGGWA
jgi:hypothetical protein